MSAFVRTLPLHKSCPQRWHRWTCTTTPSQPQHLSNHLPTSSQASESLSSSIRRAPREPGIYRFLNSSGTVLYVGKARTIRNRLHQYIVHDDTTVTGISPSSSVSPLIAAMLQEARGVDFVVTDSESAALALEASIVAEIRPKYNVLLKDDRRHPFALITFSEPYPRIVLTRTRRKKSADRLYGPFVDESRLRRVINVIQTVFPLRQRQKPLFSNRPCINYDLGRCPGVCQKLISEEEYNHTIKQVDKLLSGRVDEVLKQLKMEMSSLSNAMEYEQAAQVRDRISTLEDVFYGKRWLGDPFLRDAETVSTIVSQDSFQSRDVFAIAFEDDIAKVVLFQIRGGKVISRLVFTPDASQGASKEEMLGTVLSSHYAAITHPMEVPEEVIVTASLAEMELLSDALSEKRGKVVSVRLPGMKGKKLAAIVQKNANLEMRIETQRADDVVRDLAALEDMLVPYINVGKLRGEQFASELTEDLTQEKGHTTHFSRIECYDISHTSGANAVGSMAVFIDGKPALHEYRRYYLDTTASSHGHPDDYESIKETLRRRFKQISLKTTTDPAPPTAYADLLVIDGGKGQLSAAAEVLDDLELSSTVPVISIAKAEEAVFVRGKTQAINYDHKEGYHIMNDGVRLICRLRDEAHRTAVIAHRKRRGKQALRSGLDSVPGLGRVKRDALLEHFNGSSEAVARASPQALQEVNGIGSALAKRIYDHFHSAEASIHSVT